MQLGNYFLQVRQTQVERSKDTPVLTSPPQNTVRFPPIWISLHSFPYSQSIVWLILDFPLKIHMYKLHNFKLEPESLSEDLATPMIIMSRNYLLFRSCRYFIFFFLHFLLFRATYYYFKLTLSYFINFMQ